MLESLDLGSRKIWFRPGTSDSDAIHEVLIAQAYQPHKEVAVEKGEVWLDLGANIGAFAVHCITRGADVVCFEPEPGCFELLAKNAPEARMMNIAVTAQHERKVRFWTKPNPLNHWRGTTQHVDGFVETSVHSMYAGSLPAVDGIKMDIEGGEHEILDSRLLPHCEKLCMEYHTSRDPLVKNMRRRIDYLLDRFENVVLPLGMREALNSDYTHYAPAEDGLIFAWGAL